MHGCEADFAPDPQLGLLSCPVPQHLNCHRGPNAAQGGRSYARIWLMAAAKYKHTSADQPETSG